MGNNSGTRYEKILFKNYSLGTGEMARWVRALPAWVAGPGSGSQHAAGESHHSLTPVPGDSVNTLF